jgi:hypothetical protein
MSACEHRSQFGIPYCTVAKRRICSEEEAVGRGEKMRGGVDEDQQPGPEKGIPTYGTVHSLKRPYSTLLQNLAHRNRHAG